MTTNRVREKSMAGNNIEKLDTIFINISREFCTFIVLTKNKIKMSERTSTSIKHLISKMARTCFYVVKIIKESQSISFGKKWNFIYV